MALLDANATALQTSYYCLLTLSLLILAGNTCFPPFLRLIVWTLKNCIPKTWSPRWQKWRNVLTFILEHPRRVYTNLFPAKHTWWLVLSLVILNGIDWIGEFIHTAQTPLTVQPLRSSALAIL
jgi:Trk-type K+ transport system membrane component